MDAESWSSRRQFQVVLLVLSVVAALIVSTGSASAATGENGMLAFHGAPEGGDPNDVWIMYPDGSGAANLTSPWTDASDAPSNELDPVWSPDGSKIALISNRDSNELHIWVMDADGSNPKQVSTTPVPFQARLTWSPDGEWLAYISSTGLDRISRIRLDGSGESTVSDGSQCEDFVWAPRWSPDGSTIAFTCGGTVAFVSPDGSNHRVFRDPGFVPSWSPDGSQLAYWNMGLRVVNVDGSQDSQIVPDSALGLIMPSVWSPDGTTILYTVYVDSGTEHYTVPSSGGTPTQVLPPVELESTSAYWSWQPIPKEAGVPVVGLVDPSQGLWHLFDDTGVLADQFFYGNPNDFPIVGDWDCDGVETPGMYRQSDGYVYLRNSNTQGAADIRFFFGDPGDVPIAGDFNNDGCDTVSIYRPSSQTFYIINELGKNDGGLGAAEFSYVFGDPGDKPFVGDFDGDGVETVGLHRESTGLVYFRNSHTQGVADAQFIFGDPGDRLVAGDWNNDGKYSPALFRPSNTTMFFRYTNTQGNADNQFIPAGSQSGWLPVAGVFNK